MNVKVLVENKSCNSHLKSEHGLSLYISHEGKKILFDTGASGLFIQNAIDMGVNLDTIDYVVISHAHMDHAGGLVNFLEINKTAKVYISSHSKDDFYIKLLCFKFNIGIPKKLFEEYEERFIFVDGFCEIDQNVYLVPNSDKRSLPLGNSNKKLLVHKNNTYMKDSFNHELSLVVLNNNQLEIITGCSHNGISNMVEHAIKYFPEQDIHTVIGGFHLMGILFKNRLDETKTFITKLANKMLELNIEKIYTTH